MVKKIEGGWWMCVDFTDLNKHCLRDFYSLLLIDEKIEAVSGYELLNFLDLYKEYHQVLIYPEDAPKTTLISD